MSDSAPSTGRPAGRVFLVGHDPRREQFRRAFERGKLATSFLFVGSPGIGKRQFANWLAQGLLCAAYHEAQAGNQGGTARSELDPCGECRSCKMFMAETHPDLHVVEKPADRSEFPVDLLIGTREHRMREGLLAELAIKPAVGQRKIAIIDDADTLNEASANCLLKTLEEPPLGSILILVAGSEQRQLPTIRSRCQIIRFDPLTTDQLMSVVERLALEAEDADLRAAVEQARGSVQRLVDWLDPQLHEFREQLGRHLETMDPTSDDFAKVLVQFVDSAGTEARKRRRRLDRVIDLAVEHYRGWLGGDSSATRPLPAPRIVDAIEVCLAAQTALHANAHVTTLVESWLIELGQVLRGETLVEDSLARF
ncbi:MAG: DNA polymerase III subunit [Planctomycetales bacterium]|nr:DNA polymerase III subunit [Planctomycetales bacterium]